MIVPNFALSGSTSMTAMKSLSFASASTQKTYRYFSWRSSRFTYGDRHVSAVARTGKTPARIAAAMTAPMVRPLVQRVMILLHEVGRAFQPDTAKRVGLESPTYAFPGRGHRGGASTNVASTARPNAMYNDREDPGRSVVEDQPMGPVADEVARVAALAGHLPEPLLPVGQRTGHPDERLEHHDPDRRQVERAEPEVAHPSPAEGDPEQDQHQAEDDEAEVRRMEDDDEVREQLGPGHRAFPRLSDLGSVNPFPAAGEVLAERPVGGAADVDVGGDPGLPGVTRPDRLGEVAGAVGPDEVDRAAGPAGARELAAQEAGGGLGRLDQGVERPRAVLEVVAAGGVRGRHQPAEGGDVARLQRLDPLAHPLVLAQDVPGPLAADRVEGVPVGLELLERDPRQQELAAMRRSVPEDVRRRARTRRAAGRTSRRPAGARSSSRTRRSPGRGRPAAAGRGPACAQSRNSA